MGFLHKLWDETLAGPAPESGLGKLRKYDSFSASSTPSTSQPTITRSITIVRTSSDPRCFSSDPASFPDPPSGPTTPRSPSSPGTPVGDFKKFTRRKSPTQAGRHETTSPNISDWVIMSCLDH